MPCASSVVHALPLQRAVPARAGVPVIVAEQVERDHPQELAQLLAMLGHGDTLVMTRLDRLGRSRKDLSDVAQRSRRQSQSHGLAEL